MRGGRKYFSFVFSGAPRGSIRQVSNETQRGEWFMESAGPDMLWNNVNNEWWYDPTNGTVSNGQIVYYSSGEIIPGDKIKP